MRPTEDLTARARIRNAALDQFATHGFRRATMRGIAADADSSLGVVQHHFGNKEGLRDACDDYVLDFFREQVTRGRDLGQVQQPSISNEVFVRAPAVLRYLGRALAEGSPGVVPLFDELVSMTEDHLSQRPDVSDPRGDAAVFVAMRLGVYTLHGHLSRALGVEAFAPESLRRISASLLEIIAPEFLGTEAHRAAWDGMEPPASAESEEEPRREDHE
ncbi:TetR/AcrR family transcriptional regulator [Brevibacterium aurantiacum]|nr:TetR/AcrR family transcriptional regulator [Brevibacterium aurantiacum]